jgi:Zn-dependent protease with chaperone function
MSQAAENIARHKHLVESGNRILLLPMIVLVAWTIFVSGGSESRLAIMAVTFVAMCIGIVFGLYQQRANRKRLDDVLEQIRKLRG